MRASRDVRIEDAYLRRVPGSIEDDWVAASRMASAIGKGPSMSGPPVEYVQMARNLRRRGFVLVEVAQVGPPAEPADGVDR